MKRLTWLALLAASGLLVCLVAAPSGTACCPAPPSGKPVVNADQTVVLLWDPATKTEHFIRQASFKSDADDFGFLIPTPTQPELNESGDAAFPFLKKLTEPEIKRVPRPSRGMGCGCAPTSSDAGWAAGKAAAPDVRVLEEKMVAGFNAVVLEADSADVLVTWLKDHGYAFSPEMEAWAKPYVEKGWKVTALKVAKDKDGKTERDVAASALRLTFKTDKPLFPYREPDPKSAAETLGVKDRLLRIYFISDGRYNGELTKDDPWTGKVAWSDKLKPEDRTKLLDLLKLPEGAGPAEWRLTEFEDPWPYRAAPADLYFSPDSDQGNVKRPPIIEYTAARWPADVTPLALAAAVVGPGLWRRFRRGREK
jgi:hypothetical protein